MDYLIKGITIVDPFNETSKVGHIYIKDGCIAEIGSIQSVPDAEIIDMKGGLAIPGLVDMHVHLREPGMESAETIASGTRAAAMGGITDIACMPNTTPPIDSPSTLKLVQALVARDGLVRVHPIATITKGRAGKELSEIGDLVTHGAVAISDDGSAVMNGDLIRRALEYSKMFSIPVIEHCEDVNLAGTGVVHEGYYSTLTGLKGIPAAAEEVIVARDIILAAYTGGHIHLAHISTAGSVELVRWAKERGINVTCEVTAHHLALTDKEITSFDTRYKMNPPLRSEYDREALIVGLADGTIDCIVTDHAPHSRAHKEVEFNRAPFGIIGLETLLPVVLEELVDHQLLDIMDIIRKVTVNPARILGIERTGLNEGEPANLTLIDITNRGIINEADLVSRSSNSPWLGKPMRGFPKMTIVNGTVVMQNRKLLF